MISDTFSFLEDLRCLNLDADKVFMASFDVDSLFINVPLDETIDIIINWRQSIGTISRRNHNILLMRNIAT